ncbi:M16 family metallopeptidase [Hyunsoonleella pacifica]|uniref:Insulinase family protein n=1 Tax=Hyunsoonleella pacifica TaxID=1080224 RepID=A0A4Q9FTA4_9FLAO|nr:pitrilysin family protein [Hyunsoonleella pacifica]TBN18599.1 insulinase family protein [Hyunsoonleella pacifica]GGD03115.1 peptidase M16 [Hyunsoonleella pacifica]
MKSYYSYLRNATVILFITTISFQINAQIKKTAEVEGITEYVLDNGLKVLLFPDNSAQTITVNITYMVGSRHEGYGEKGMAHLLEHMVFKGTPNHPDIPKELTEHGARPNGTTWYDRTNYFETFNATDENLDWALDLEADRMVNSYIAKKDLESEFSVVRNEFESGENSPTRVLMQKVISAAFLWHNYGNSTIGNRSDIERVPIENLQAFYKKYYRPDNAVLMVTGKFERDKILKLIEKKFGAIKNPDAPIRDIPTIEPAQDGEKHVALSRVGDLQIVSALYHTPAGSHEDYAALAVAENILTNQPSGRLYKALVDEKKASSVWSFSPFTKEPSFMYFNVDVPSDKSLNEAESTLVNLLDDLKSNPITEEEVKRAKSNILKRYDQIIRNSSYLGTFMSEFIGAGDWRLSFIQRDRVEAMTADKVNTAVQRYLINTNRTVGNFIPTKKPIRVEIEHTEGLEELVTNYKGKEGLDAGEAFDVSYENIQNRLNSGKLQKTPIEYGFIKKNNRGKTVNLLFVIRNGNVNDFMNKGRLANYTARMLNKGTTNYSRQDIEDKLSALKSSVSLSGGNGRISARISTTEEYLMETLALMTDMLKNPTFNEAELEKLKTADLANIERNKTEPQFLASKALGNLNQHYKKGHPLYSTSVEDDIENINAITVEGLKNYYDEFYGISDNASLVAIGNIDENALKNYFETEFANFKVDKPYKPIEDPYRKNNAINEKIKTPDKKNAISIGVMAFEGSVVDEDYAALQVASSIFGGGFLNSRIAGRLRQKDGISYGAGGRVDVDGDPKDSKSSILVYAIYAPENADKVQKGFSEEIERYINEGITEDELKVAITSWVQGRSVSRAKDNELSRTINNNLYYDRDMMFYKGIEDKVTSLTVEDVNKVIKKYFKTFDNWTVVNAGDFEKAPEIKSEKKVD